MLRTASGEEEEGDWKGWKGRVCLEEEATALKGERAEEESTLVGFGGWEREDVEATDCS